MAGVEKHAHIKAIIKKAARISANSPYCFPPKKQLLVILS